MNLIVGCLSKEVTKKVKDGINEIADASLTKINQIEPKTPNDKKMMELAKSHAVSLKTFAESLESCELQKE